jgi:hypothetical protein
MSRFVDECRKEWTRLGVPDSEANEMASDLEADLTEAQAEGRTPEEVVGNGYFDARSFAASWALARGVAGVTAREPNAIRVRPIVLTISAVVCAFFTGLGLLLLLQPHFGTQSFAVAFSSHLNHPPLPPIAFVPHHGVLGEPGGRIPGLILLLIGLNGLAILAWVWRPWSTRRNGSGFDQNIGMPSFL